jgi:hypothetical protein
MFDMMDKHGHTVHLSSDTNSSLLLKKYFSVEVTGYDGTVARQDITANSLNLDPEIS